MRQPVDFKTTKPLPGTHRFVDHQAAIPPGEREIPKQGTPPPVYEDVTPVETEMAYAREIEHGARETLLTILEDARLGKSLDTPRVRQVVNRMTESILRNPDAMTWLTHLKKKHEYTATHSLRVCVLSLVFGRHLGYDRERLNILGIGALLHDIGKLKVSNEILDKPGRLTAEEYEVMKSHVPEGLKLLENENGIPAVALEVVGRHHERYNGKGYIAGLTGDTIGEFGLISALADTYDAMTSDRSYHPGRTPVDALKTIYDGRENTFHPWLAEQFIQCMGIYPIGSVVELSTGGVGVVISANRQRRLRPRVALVLSPDKKRYNPAPILDLMQVTQDTQGKPYEIRSVLPPGAFGINPTDYIPIRH
jgi:putative nucleotidyltransferase with HDIG domain